MPSTPARARRSSNAASPSPPPSKKSLPPAQVPAKNDETVLTRRKHTTDAQLQGSAATNVSEAQHLQLILQLILCSARVLSRFFALFTAVAHVVALLLCIFIFTPIGAFAHGNDYDTKAAKITEMITILKRNLFLCCAAS